MPHSAAAQTGASVPRRAVAVERYRDAWVHHLLGIARDLSLRVIDRLERECGYDEIRPSLGPFITLVWREPRPLSELAQQLSISRQACSKVARHAERSGYVERVDGQDGVRAQRVRLTDRGRELVEDSVRLIFEAEAFYAERIGVARLRRFNAASSSLFFGLGLQNQTDAGFGDAARRSIAVLPLVAARIEEDLLEAIRARGHDELQPSHARLISLIGDGQRSVSEIARLQGVSRQATGATVHDLESLGYVRRDTHETDGRAVHVRLAERGDELIRDSLEALEELERSLREMLGSRRFADLVNVAAELHGVLTLEEELAALGGGSPVAERADGARSGPHDHELHAIAALLEQRLGDSAARRLGRILTGRTRARQRWRPNGGAGRRQGEAS